MAHHAHDPVGEHPHQHGQEGHHGGSGGYRYPGEAACGLPAPGAQALSYQGGGRVLHAVAGQVAETFGYDGEGVGGNRDRAQRRDYHRGGYVGPSRDEVLQPQRPGDSECVPVDFPAVAGASGPGLVLFCQEPAASEFPARAEDVPQQEKSGAEHGQTRTYRGSGDAHAQFEYEQVVEAHVKHAHADAGDAGYLGVAAGHQRALAEYRELVGGQEHRVDAEVCGRVGANLLRTAEPSGKRSAERDSEQGEGEADHQHREHALAEDSGRTPEIPGPAAVGYLHAESRAVGVAEAAEYPGRRAHQPDCCRLRRTQPAHHGRVDVAHQAHGQLGHDGGEGEQQRELELLAPAHFGSRPQFAEKYVLAFSHRAANLQILYTKRPPDGQGAIVHNFVENFGGHGPGKLAGLDILCLNL